jgi:hypothetical protein
VFEKLPAMLGPISFQISGSRSTEIAFLVRFRLTEERGELLNS